MSVMIALAGAARQRTLARLGLLSSDGQQEVAPKEGRGSVGVVAICLKHQGRDSGIWGDQQAFLLLHLCIGAFT
jgi:hypothetical protein